MIFILPHRLALNAPRNGPTISSIAARLQHKFLMPDSARIALPARLQLMLMSTSVEQAMRRMTPRRDVLTTHVNGVAPAAHPRSKASFPINILPRDKHTVVRLRRNDASHHPKKNHFHDLICGFFAHHSRIFVLDHVHAPCM